MIRVLSIICLLVTFCGFSQRGFINSSDLLKDDVNASISLNIYGEGYINSNSFTSSVINAAYRGENLDGSLTDNIMSNLKEQNLLVSDISVGGNLFYIFKESNMLISLGYDQRAFLSSTFTDDFIKLLFNGNQQYQNETLELGGSQYEFQRYHNFKLGAVKKFKTPGIGIGVNAGLVRGINYQSVDINKADFYTAADGEYIEIDVDAEIRQPSGNTGNWGLGFDFFIEKYLPKGNKISFKVNDIGFVKWKDITSYSSDNEYQFEGIVIEDLFNIDTSTFSDLNDRNSAQELLGMDTDTVSLTTVLPFLMQLNYTHNFSEKLRVMVGGLYQSARSSYPALDIEVDYTLPLGVTVLGELDFGGAGYLNYALGLKANLVKNHIFVMGKFYVLESLVAAKGTSGEGVRLYLQYIF